MKCDILYNFCVVNLQYEKTYNIIIALIFNFLFFKNVTKINFILRNAKNGNGMK